MLELKNLFKKITFKDILLMLGILLLYFLPLFFFKIDIEYYDSLKKINVPPLVFSIVWTIIYLCMTNFIFWHLKIKNTHNRGAFWVYLILNYLTESSYVYVFFTLHNLFLSFVVCLFTFLTITLVSLEAFVIKKQSVYFLIPYLIWSAFASVLAVLIYIWN